MKQIAKVENDKVTKFPIILKDEFPLTCFPIETDLEQKHLPEGYFLVDPDEQEKPKVNFDEELEDDLPKFVNGKCKKSWKVKKLNLVELKEKEKKYENTIKEQIKQYIDNVVKIKGYNDIISACSYINSSNTVFSKEARACLDWRDEVWSNVYSTLDEIKNNKKDRLEYKDIVKDLPKINWPK